MLEDTGCCMKKREFDKSIWSEDFLHVDIRKNDKGDVQIMS
jgi:hypothetical protein